MIFEIMGKFCVPLLVTEGTFNLWKGTLLKTDGNFCHQGWDTEI
jgi:hypothetical protein